MIQKRGFFCIMLIFNASVINSHNITIKVTDLKIPELITAKEDLKAIYSKIESLESCLKNKDDQNDKDNKDISCKESEDALSKDFNNIKDKLKNENRYENSDLFKGDMNSLPFDIKDTYGLIYLELTLLVFTIYDIKEPLSYYNGKANVKISDINITDNDKYYKKKCNEASIENLDCKIFFDRSISDYEKKDYYKFLTGIDLGTNGGSEKKSERIDLSKWEEYTIQISPELGINDDVSKIFENYECRIYGKLDKSVLIEFKEKRSENLILI